MTKVREEERNKDFPIEYIFSNLIIFLIFALKMLYWIITISPSQPLVLLQCVNKYVFHNIEIDIKFM